MSSQPDMPTNSRPQERRTPVRVASGALGDQRQFAVGVQLADEQSAVVESSTDLAPLTSKYAKLSFADIELLIRLHDAGKTQVEIAQVIGCSQPTVSATLAKLRQTPDTVRALLKSDTAGVVTNWRRAARIAAKRGDHRPAREWLEAAHPELRPQPATHGHGGGVQINIGMPGQPIGLPSIEVVQVSPQQLTAKSETN